MSDDDLRRIVTDALAGQPPEEWRRYTYETGSYDITHLRANTERILRAVERAARAAAFREAAEVCEAVIARRKEAHGYPHGYNAIMDCVEALRARAEGQR